MDDAFLITAVGLSLRYSSVPSQEEVLPFSDEPVGTRGMHFALQRVLADSCCSCDPCSVAILSFFWHLWRELG